MILKTRALINVGSAYRLIGYPWVTYGCVGYPLVTYGSVGKGTLSFRGVSDMSYLPHMSDLPYYVHVWDGLHSYVPFALFARFVCCVPSALFVPCALFVLFPLFVPIVRFVRSRACSNVCSIITEW